MTIGEKIQVARKNAGLTQAQLAEKSGVATISIHQYEAGKRQPRLDQLSKITRALNTTVFNLTEGNFVGIDTSAIIEFDDEKKARLDEAFKLLNDFGKDIAIERVEELAKVPDYQKDTK